MEVRPTGTANVARPVRTSEGRCGGAIARIDIYMSLPLLLKQNNSHHHHLPAGSPYHQLEHPKRQIHPSHSRSSHDPALRLRVSDTTTMQSTEIKNWVTALVVGVLGLALATCGTIIAFKQLRRTKRPDDIEAAETESV